MNCSRFLLFIIIFLFHCSFVQSQNLDEWLEHLSINLNKNAVERDSALYPAKLVIFPQVTYNSQTGWYPGIAAKSIFNLGKSESDTRTSNISLGYNNIRGKHQLISDFTLLSSNDAFLLTGQFHFQNIPDYFYGLGPSTLTNKKETFAYNQLLIDPILAKRTILPQLFVGFGIRYNKTYKLIIDENGPLITTGSGSTIRSTAVGYQLALIYDSRDNIINPKKGFYVKLISTIHGEILNGEEDFGLTRIDARYFIDLFKNKSSILAIQLIAHISHGDTPLLEMARLGGAQIMRAYHRGRYHDRNSVASQIEWRQKLSDRWGLVVFGGYGFVTSSISTFSPDHLRSTLGIGVRFLIDKKNNLNLRLDTTSGQIGYPTYLRLGEAF